MTQDSDNNTFNFLARQPYKGANRNKVVETNKGLRFCNKSKPENGGRRVERRRIKNIAQNTLTLTIGNYESFLIFVFCLVFDSVARDVIFAMMVCMPN